MKRVRNAVLAALCILLLSANAYAAEIGAQEDYLFTGADFAADGQMPEGIFVSAVPAAEQCVLCMGERVIRAGDVLSREDFERLTLRPVCDESGSAELRFQPISGGDLGQTQVFSLQIKSTKNEAPTASDLTLETYKNIANEGSFRASDPEGDLLSYRLESKPRRGTVELGENGSFVYTPKKNKVGEDSFTYSAVDLAGNVSNTATVNVRILQPLDAETFDDLGPAEQFTAMWMREQGLYGGARITDKLCFCPEEALTRGEFLAMAMELAGVEPEIGLPTDVFLDQQEAPEWIRPYLSSALRRGVALGAPEDEGLVIRPNEPLRTAEAAVIVRRLFRIDATQSVGSFLFDHAEEDAAVAALEAAGVTLRAEAEAVLTRAAAGQLLYAVAQARQTN